MDDDLSGLLDLIAKKSEAGGQGVPEKAAFINALSIVAELSAGFDLTTREAQAIFPIVLEQCQRGLIRK